MPHDPKKYFHDMLDGCEFLIGFTRGRTVEDYLRDRGFRSAIERELQNIGEALFQLNRRNPEVAEQVAEYQRIIGFRHVLVHGYDNLKAEIVWEVIEFKLPLLRDELRQLLGDEEMLP